MGNGTEIKSGIYIITCIVNKKRYVGSSVNIHRRLLKHKNNLRKNKHINSNLQNSWNKYGEEYFLFDTIELCEENVLIQREQFYIDTLKPEFNIRKVADSNLGVPIRDQTRNKISNALKGVPKPKFTDSHKENMSKSHIGLTGNNSDRWIITLPDNSEIEIESLRNFCKINGLNYQTSHGAYLRKSKHKGYTFRKVSE